MDFDVTLVRDVTKEQFGSRLAEAVWYNLVAHHGMGSYPAAEGALRSAVAGFLRAHLREETQGPKRHILRLTAAGAGGQDQLERELADDLMAALGRALPAPEPPAGVLPAVIGGLRGVLVNACRPVPA